MEENLYLEYDAFLRLIKRNTDVPHSFLLGACASISSSIQSAYDCIWEWKRDIYITKNINAAEYYKNHKNEQSCDESPLNVAGLYIRKLPVWKSYKKNTI